MCMIDASDADWVEIRRSMPKARKTYRCDECGRTIHPGERYERGFAICGGDPYSWRMCAHCRSAAGWLFSVCGGMLHHGVLDDLEEHWREEPEYHSMWLGRAILGMRRQWRKKDGSLMPPMAGLPAAVQVIAQ